MRELSLKDVQNESLAILSIIDDFCIKNKISYSLGYGALIGAVRHNGFIPWDDDIDIIMTRPNYDRFIELVKGNNNRIFNDLDVYAPELNNCFYCITRICDSKNTIVKKYFQWAEEDTGIWVDLFPIDTFPPSQSVQCIRRQVSRCFNTCGANVPLLKVFGINRILKILYKKMLYGRYNRREEINKYLEFIEKLPPFGCSEFVTNFGSPYGDKDVHRLQVFEKYKRVIFENKEISILENYHEYLTKIYGNYMNLPPLSQQVRGHTDNKYFWR